ncbi:MAG: SDR family NAD(P)-dependent oxidoreductase, partial [Anaerolineae bacterium]
MNSPLQDKIAIVTGGAQGLGAAICQRLASEGAHVVVADLNLEGAEATATTIHAE